jgi:hypothetical protein
MVQCNQHFFQSASLSTYDIFAPLDASNDSIPYDLVTIGRVVGIKTMLQRLRLPLVHVDRL